MMYGLIFSLFAAFRAGYLFKNFLLFDVSAW